jgi:hypothetical protein
MRKVVVALCAAVIGFFAATQGSFAGQVYRPDQMRPIFVILPARGVNFSTLGSAANVTVPFFTAKIESPLDKRTYQFSIVGTNPTSNKVSTTVKYVPIVLRVKFSGGVVLDPTKPACNDTVSVENRFFGSPLFESTQLTSNGVAVGDTQIIDAFQRAEFWGYTQGSGYHVLLAPSAKVRVVDVTAPTGSSVQPGACAGKNHDLGMIDINAWDTILVTLINKYAKTDELPIVAAYNVVETSGGCCIIGYHNAYGRSTGTQTFATGAYTDAGIFSPGLEDIHAWTHELGEWANDPFVNNATPAWGHVGQQPGCQNNLEVGDPLTGTPFVVKFEGFTYHPQELAFFSWFFRTRAFGTGHEHSWDGAFETSQGACH